MVAPWYIYVIAALVALPVYVLLAVGLYGTVRTLLVWIFMPPTESDSTRK